jgi:hypothetical protein
MCAGSNLPIPPPAQRAEGRKEHEIGPPTLRWCCMGAAPSIRDRRETRDTGPAAGARRLPWVERSGAASVLSVSRRDDATRQVGRPRRGTGGSTHARCDSCSCTAALTVSLPPDRQPWSGSCRSGMRPVTILPWTGTQRQSRFVPRAHWWQLSKPSRSSYGGKNGDQTTRALNYRNATRYLPHSR